MTAMEEVLGDHETRLTRLETEHENTRQLVVDIDERQKNMDGILSELREEFGKTASKDDILMLQHHIDEKHIGVLSSALQSVPEKSHLDAVRWGNFWLAVAALTAVFALLMAVHG